MERIRAQRPDTCSDANWRHLLHAMNKTTDEVEVERAALQEVSECHHRHTRTFFPVPDGRTKMVKVDRMKLFAWVGLHGEECGKVKR